MQAAASLSTSEGLSLCPSGYRLVDDGEQDEDDDEVDGGDEFDIWM